MYNLYYRPFNIRDSDEVFQMTSEYKIGYYCGWKPHKHVSDTIKAIQTFWGEIGCKAIVDRSINKIVGCINIKYLNPKEVEIGYWIGQKYRHKGYITQAIEDVIRYCFDDLKVDTIYCGYFAGNDISKRVNDKHGFQYHKTVRTYIPAFDEFRNQIITKLSIK